MGAKSSSIASLDKNEYIQRFTGVQNISQDDVFWNEFLQSGFPPPVTRDSFQSLYSVLTSQLSNLAKNDPKSQNFTVLLKFFITEASNYAANFPTHQNHSKVIVNQLTNAMLIIRCFSKYLIENYSERDMIRYFMPSTSDITTSVPLVDYIMQLLFTLIINIPITDMTYGLINETMLTIIVLLSPQLYSPLSGDLSVFHQYVMWGKSSSKAIPLVYALMRIYITNAPCPYNLIHGQSSFLWNAASTLASGLISVVTLGYMGSGRSTGPSNKLVGIAQNGTIDAKSNSLVKHIIPDKQLCINSCHLLTRQANMLLLLLTAHATVNLPKRPCTAPNNGAQSINGGGTTSPTSSGRSMVIRNPYREALFHLTNISENALNGDNCTRIDFSAFLDVAAKSLELDSSTLLVYLLLHRNSNFRIFMLQDKNYEKLLVPLLGILYRVSGQNSHLMYMILIVILILTEHSQFIENVHNVQLKMVPWKMEKTMTEVSLGSLLVYVLVKTVQHHVNQLKERYLHINSLAALANLSSKITRLNQETSSALVNLVVMLLKRYNRIEARIKELKQEQSSSSSVSQTDSSLTSSSPSSPSSMSKVDAVSASITQLNLDDLRNDLILLEEVIRTMLEIINSVITHSLVTNQHLVYALLHQKDKFLPLKKNPLFEDIMHNLDVVMSFFIQKLEKECSSTGGQVVMPEQVMQLINKHITALPRHQHLKKSAELKFKYVEESSPDDFFVPYVWLLMYHGASDFFDPTIVRVFLTSDAPV